MKTCVVDDCSKPTRSKSADLCAMHYHRQYRHGDVSKTAVNLSVGPGRRYRTTHRPDHPLAPASGRIYVHRVVLFDAIGDGPHACRWCGTEVHWRPALGQVRLDVDHIDGMGDNNDLSNLVPACPPCNSTRGAQAREAKLREAGFWSANDTIARTRKGRREPIEAVSGRAC